MSHVTGGQTYVLVLGDGGQVVDEEEVDVVRGPAHHEDGDDHREHDDNLVKTWVHHKQT